MDDAVDISIQFMNTPGAAFSQSSSDSSDEGYSMLVRSFHYFITSVWIGPPTIEQCRIFINMCASITVVLVFLLTYKKITHVLFSIHSDRESDLNRLTAKQIVAASGSEDRCSHDATHESVHSSKQASRQNSFSKPMGEHTDSSKSFFESLLQYLYTESKHGELSDSSTVATSLNGWAAEWLAKSTNRDFAKKSNLAKAVDVMLDLDRQDRASGDWYQMKTEAPTDQRAGMEISCLLGIPKGLRVHEAALREGVTTQVPTWVGKLTDIHVSADDMFKTLYHEDCWKHAGNLVLGESQMDYTEEVKLLRTRLKAIWPISAREQQLVKCTYPQQDGRRV